jgi:hypothetical protein
MGGKAVYEFPSQKAISTNIEEILDCGPRRIFKARKRSFVRGGR